MHALTRLVAQLPEDFPAPIFIVHHMSADTDGQALMRVLNRNGKLECTQPNDGESFEPSRIYLAPADHHMMCDAEAIHETH